MTTEAEVRAYYPGLAAMAEAAVRNDRIDLTTSSDYEVAVQAVGGDVMLWLTTEEMEVSFHLEASDALSFADALRLVGARAVES